MFAIEYKGGDHFSNDDSRAKAAVGNLGAAKSGGRVLYLMAQVMGAQGRNIREQLLEAIAGRT